MHEYTITIKVKSTKAPGEAGIDQLHADFAEDFVPDGEHVVEASIDISHVEVS